LGFEEFVGSGRSVLQITPRPAGESWAGHIEAGQSTFVSAPTPLIPAFAAELDGTVAAGESYYN